MGKFRWPKITVAIPAKNDAEGLKKCLRSIANQTYDKKLLEIIVIDDHSTDSTPKVARSFKARVIKNVYHGRKIINRSEVGKAIGLHNATGEFIYILEQDIELIGESFFQKLVKPLIEDKTLAGSFTREGVPKPNMPWATRFISYHPAQCDPMYEFFSPSVESTITSSKPGYFICSYTKDKIPPFGRMMFRIDFIKKTEIWNWPGFFDLDSVAALVKNGYNKFAYVPKPGIYHYHATTLRSLIFKRVRNLHYHFFPYLPQMDYKWFDVRSKKGVLKILFWIIYANLIIPATIRGIFKAIKFREPVLLAEPLIAVTTTDILIWNFLSNKTGRKLINQSIKTLFTR